MIPSPPNLVSTLVLLDVCLVCKGEGVIQFPDVLAMSLIDFDGIVSDRESLDFKISYFGPHIFAYISNLGSLKLTHSVILKLFNIC